MIELLQNTQSTLEIDFSAGDADGAVTTTVKDADGGTVSTGPATHTSVGHYTYALPPQSQVMWLTVTWAGTWGGVAQSITTGAGQNDGTASEVQVAGGHLFTVAQLRAFGDQRLGSLTDEQLIDARSRVTVLFEDYCDVAFVPRYGRVVMDGNWGAYLWLPNTRISRIRSAIVDGVALAGQDLSQITFSPDGKLYRNSYYGWWSGINPQNVTISYEHGYPNTPEDVARAAMILTRYELVNTDMTDRMVTFQNDLGVVRLSLPGNDSPTGIPIVDSVLNRYRSVVEVF